MKQVWASLIQVTSCSLISTLIFAGFFNPCLGCGLSLQYVWQRWWYKITHNPLPPACWFQPCAWEGLSGKPWKILNKQTNKQTTKNKPTLDSWSEWQSRHTNAGADTSSDSKQGRAAKESPVRPVVMNHLFCKQGHDFHFTGAHPAFHKLASDCTNTKQRKSICRCLNDLLVDNRQMDSACPWQWVCRQLLKTAGWKGLYFTPFLLYTITGCLITSTLTLQLAEEQQLATIRFFWNTNSFTG